MKHKIEEKVLQLIDEISRLVESARKNEADEFPNGSLSIIGSSKKLKKKRKSKNEALDSDSSGHITPDELKKQLDVSKAQLAAAKASTKLAQSLPDKIKRQDDRIAKLQGKSSTSEPTK